MVPALVFSTLIPVLITVLCTSGIWIGAYFVAFKHNERVNNYYQVSPNNSAIAIGTTIPPPPPPPTDPPLQHPSCALDGTYSACTSKCRLTICESIPVGLEYPAGSPVHMSTTDCWVRLADLAQREIVIGSYYWTLLLNNTEEVTDDQGTASDGKRIFDALMNAASRGVSIRISMSDPSPDYTTAEPDALRSAYPDLVRRRILYFPKWFDGHGILHTKAWSIDGNMGYVGSANFDWRSMTQVKEIGVMVESCPCLAEDLQRMLDIYWDMGAPDSVKPTYWPSKYTTNANRASPYVIGQPGQPPLSVFFSSSPPGLNSCNRENDIDAMVATIDAADEFVYLAVMDYAPTTLYNKPNFYYDKLDNSLRRAAFDRRVRVKLMMGKWIHTNHAFYGYLHSLNSLDWELPCTYNYTSGHCATGTKGSLEVRLFEVPSTGYESIPYTRVQHNKYFVTDKTVYIGTSNWSADYWLYTGGIGISVSSADGGRSQFVDDVIAIFNRDWDSNYTTPISDYDNAGNKIR